MSHPAPLSRVTPDWPAVPGMACRRCGDVARANPKAPRVWGCLACGVSAACDGGEFVVGRAKWVKREAVNHA